MLNMLNILILNLQMLTNDYQIKVKYFILCIVKYKDIQINRLRVKRKIIELI